jgi:poly-gamma-glutamate synthesis protein (capsule biosynthesis protein)
MSAQRRKRRTRREFLQLAAGAAAALRMYPVMADSAPTTQPSLPAADALTLFLCGDVMTGRGIDQVLPHPGDPRIYESYMTSARGYVQLAEEAHGPIPRPTDFPYIWGDALAELNRMRPDARIINLETAVTTAGDPWPGKGIQYRMHPANIPCLTAAGIDCCALANNHVLDWGYAGLGETLTSLEKARIKTAGAGLSAAQAQNPAILEIPGKGRVLVFAVGDASSGIPGEWGAREDSPGVDLLPDLSAETARRLAERIRSRKRPGDLAVVSIHWGGNWGYAIPPEQRIFAHRLIDAARVDAVHGHSSHHPKGIEIYQGKPILYGCGDFLNDYEGISGHEELRGDLALMYFLTVERGSGRLLRLEMTPLQIRRFQLHYAQPSDVRWLHQILERESERLGTGIKRIGEQGLLATTGRAR